MESSGAAHQVAHALIQLEIPLEWMVVLIPMTLGVITGLPIAVVGAAFPVVANLISAMGASDMTLPLVILAFVSGFAGVALSPLHLCLILSNEYFGASWPSIYRRLWLPTTIILVGGICYFLLLNTLTG
jgi:hypothetical protein